VVALHQAARVCRTGLRREVVAVDDVTTVGGQRDVAARLHVVGARLRELAGHAAHLDDGHRGTVGENDGHLEDGLHAVADLLCGRSREGLSTVAALQQEGATARGRRETVTEHVDLTGEHEGRKRGDLRAGSADGVCIGPGRLLLDLEGAPIVETGDHLGISEHNGFGRVYHGVSFIEMDMTVETARTAGT